MPTLGDLFTIQPPKDGLTIASIAGLKCDKFPIPVMKEVEIQVDNCKNLRFVIRWNGKEDMISVTFNPKWEMELVEFLELTLPLETKFVLQNVELAFDPYGDITRESKHAFLDRAKREYDAKYLGTTQTPPPTKRTRRSWHL